MTVWHSHIFNIYTVLFTVCFVAQTCAKESFKGSPGKLSLHEITGLGWGAHEKRLNVKRDVGSCNAKNSRKFHNTLTWCRTSGGSYYNQALPNWHAMMASSGGSVYSSTTHVRLRFGKQCYEKWYHPLWAANENKIITIMILLLSHKMPMLSRYLNWSPF